MVDLSPQAQEVFWAFNRAASGTPDDCYYLPAIAAAVRAAAEQVVHSQPSNIELHKLADELEAFGSTDPSQQSG